MGRVVHDKIKVCMGMLHFISFLTSLITPSPKSHPYRYLYNLSSHSLTLRPQFWVDCFSFKSWSCFSTAFLNFLLCSLRNSPFKLHIHPPWIGYYPPLQIKKLKKAVGEYGKLRPFSLFHLPPPSSRCRVKSSSLLYLVPAGEIVVVGNLEPKAHETPN